MQEILIQISKNVMIGGSIMAIVAVAITIYLYFTQTDDEPKKSHK